MIYPYERDRPHVSGQKMKSMIYHKYDIGQDCGSAKHGTIRMASFDFNIIKGEIKGE